MTALDRTDRPVTYHLSFTEIHALQAVADHLAAAGADAGLPVFYDQAWELATMLPDGVRRFLHEFRTIQPSAVLIRGFPVDDRRIGPTPPDWRQAARSGLGRYEEFVLAMYATALGESFTWSTLQAGRMIQNVLPIAGEDREQSGHGQVMLEWHTEDGFHPHRCDYLLLLGMRNPDATPTTLASIRDVKIADEHRAALAQRRFFIVPDDEHLRQLDPADPGVRRMRVMRENPEPVAVLFGAIEDPYLRIDPYFMRCAEGDVEAEMALKSLVSELERVQQDIVVGPGDALIIDNYRAVHGRKAFTARFDGTDRWLKKIIVARDLRPSRHLRASAGSRVIG
jgi:L-asparagine oxygenase